MASPIPAIRQAPKHSMSRLSPTAKPELVCPVEVFRRSLLPVGRIDLAVEAPGSSDSGFALACVRRGRTSPASTAKPEKVCPNQLFFEGRRSLGSRRLKCGGFGLQHLWFCYRPLPANPGGIPLFAAAVPETRHNWNSAIHSCSRRCRFAVSPDAAHLFGSCHRLFCSRLRGLRSIFPGWSLWTHIQGCLGV